MVIYLSATIHCRIFGRRTVSVGEHEDFILDIVLGSTRSLFPNQLMLCLLLVRAAVQMITTIHQAVLVIIETIAILIFSVGLW